LACFSIDLLSPPEAAAPLLEPVEPVEADGLEELPVEPELAPDDLLLLPVEPVLPVEPLLDGELALEPVEPLVEPDVPPEVWAIARPMDSAAAIAMRVLFISEISCWMEVEAEDSRPSIQRGGPSPGCRTPSIHSRLGGAWRDFPMDGTKSHSHRMR
jgi:hypothetical protein